MVKIKNNKIKKYNFVQFNSIQSMDKFVQDNRPRHASRELSPRSSLISARSGAQNPDRATAPIDSMFGRSNSASSIGTDLTEDFFNDKSQPQNQVLSL
jgi:hypothetical protein